MRHVATGLALASLVGCSWGEQQLVKVQPEKPARFPNLLLRREKPDIRNIRIARRKTTRREPRDIRHSP